MFSFYFIDANPQKAVTRDARLGSGGEQVRPRGQARVRPHHRHQLEEQVEGDGQQRAQAGHH